MSLTTRSLKTFVAVLGGCMLAGGSAAAADTAGKPFDFTGSWMTTEGIVPFTQHGAALEGTYPLKKGRMSATVAGDTAEGYWAQEDSVHRCTGTRDGSHYWGRVKFTADPGGQTFKGRRNYCDLKISEPGGDEFVGKRR